MEKLKSYKKMFEDSYDNTPTEIESFKDVVEVSNKMMKTAKILINDIGYHTFNFKKPTSVYKAGMLDQFPHNYKVNDECDITNVSNCAIGDIWFGFGSDDDSLMVMPFFIYKTKYLNFNRKLLLTPFTFETKQQSLELFDAEWQNNITDSGDILHLESLDDIMRLSKILIDYVSDENNKEEYMKVFHIFEDNCAASMAKEMGFYDEFKTKYPEMVKKIEMNRNMSKYKI